MINVFKINIPEEYKSAGPYDLIALLAVAGANPLFIQKAILESIVYGIVHVEFIHLSGPTGSAKSSLVEALSREPENFRLVCNYLGLEYRPIHIYEIEMALFDTPAELYQRRSLNERGTFDEESVLVRALKDSANRSKKYYPVIFLKEMGRVHTASIQGGLLDLMTRSDISLPNGDKVKGGKVSFIADSNYQALEDAQHTLVTFDDALKRRFTVNVMLDYLSEKEERAVLHHILIHQDGAEEVDKEMVKKIVRLGQMVRNYRAEGNLLSVVAPTIYGYLTCYRMARKLSHLGLQIIIMNTILGNASKDDLRMVETLIQTVFNSPSFSNKDSVFSSVW